MKKTTHPICDCGFDPKVPSTTTLCDGRCNGMITPLEAEHQRADANARWAEETVASNKDLLRRLEEARAFIGLKDIKPDDARPGLFHKDSAWHDSDCAAWLEKERCRVLARLAPLTKMMEND